MLHLFPWLSESRRREAVASARRQQAAEHQAAVRRLATAAAIDPAVHGRYTICPYCPDADALIRRARLIRHLAAEHASLVGENP